MHLSTNLNAFLNDLLIRGYFSLKLSALAVTGGGGGARGTQPPKHILKDNGLLF